MKQRRKVRKPATVEEWKRAASPAGRFWPVPRGESITDLCRSLDESFNQGLDAPRDIRNRPSRHGVRAFDSATVQGENEAAPDEECDLLPAPNRDACKEANG